MKLHYPAAMLCLLILGGISTCDLHATIIFSDTFDEPSLDEDIWSEIVSNGLSFDQNEQGTSVSVSGGVLALAQGASDSGGAVISRLFAVGVGETIVIRKRTRLRAVNEYFRGVTAIVDASTKAPALQVQYLNYHSGFSADYFALGNHDAGSRVPSLWDTWFDERITFTPETGLSTLQVNDGPVMEYVREPFLTNGEFRIALTPYGWFTGHSQEVDSIAVEVVPTDVDMDGLPDIWEREIIDLDPHDVVNSLEALLPDDDLDHDGLVNSEEYAHQTNPLDGDSDDDFFSDGYELKHDWDPLVAGAPELEHAREVIQSIQLSSDLQDKSGLFTENCIKDISLDDMMIEVKPGNPQVKITFPLEFADVLGHWTPVPENQRPVWVDEITDSRPTRFYRIRYRASNDPFTLAEGLIMHLPMNGNLLDASGHGLDGVQDRDINGAGSTLTNDRFSKEDSSYLFYNSKYASIAVSNFPNQFQQLPELTICIWVQINEQYADNRYIAGNFFWGNRHGWCLKLSPAEGFFFETYIHKTDASDNPFTWLGAISNVTPQLGKWYHLTGQFTTSGDTTTHRIFIDGILAATRTIPGAYAYRDGNRFGMGGDIARGQVLANSRVDDLRVYERLLSQREIRALAFDRP